MPRTKVIVKILCQLHCDYIQDISYKDKCQLCDWKTIEYSRPMYRGGFGLVWKYEHRGDCMRSMD